MTTAEEKEILSLLCKVHELEIDKVGCLQIFSNSIILKVGCQIFSNSNILKLVCRQISECWWVFVQG